MLKGWQDIKNAPLDGTRVHLGFKHLQNFDVIAHFIRGAWRLSGMTKIYGRPAPSHWRPLPPAPESVEGGSYGKRV